jgi:hypothetical protein
LIFKTFAFPNEQKEKRIDERERERERERMMKLE